MAARVECSGLGSGECQPQAARPDLLYCSAQGLGCRKVGRKRGVWRPNKSFKPKPLRYANHMAGKACHVLRSTTRLGLTLVLGPMPKIRASAIASLSAAGAIVVAGLFVYPLAMDSWTELQAKHAQERDFVAASDSDQAMIVRSLLINGLRKPPLCSPWDQNWSKDAMCFDRV